MYPALPSAAVPVPRRPSGEPLATRAVGNNDKKKKNKN